MGTEPAVKGMLEVATTDWLKPSALRRIVKRALDVSIAGTLLFFLAPLIAVLAALIMLGDGGPAIYRRRVMGLRGDFDAFKLRTMRVNADDILSRDAVLRGKFQVNYKLKDDPRVTRIGAFLRKTSMDELPQLWNVLKGEMSMVGPRMITSAELARYGKAAWIFNITRPGLTGYWQVEGRQEVSYEERVNMDLFYLRNSSIGMDLKILLKTPWRVIRGVGAY
jgi:lipopolysaccharide/colanic/teichoic acid biosynthesis glycosyltransferase